MERNIQNLLDFITRIEGWLSNVEQVGLMHIPQAVDHLEGAIVEIGSFKGKSTVCLGCGSKLLTMSKKPIVAIDPFGLPSEHYQFGWCGDEYFDAFWRNITQADLQNFVLPIRKFSTEAYDECPRHIAALFIDGDHSYEGVAHDIRNYSSRLVKGGLIAFHDYSNPQFPDVKRAVDDLCTNTDFEYVCNYDSLRVLRKL